MENQSKMGLNFLRRDAARYSKFGKGRGKKASWRAPKGRDNKMREKRRGYAAVVSIGYKKPASEEKIIEIINVNDLNKLKKNEVGFVKALGKKKKIEIAKKAKEMKIKLKNMNPEKYLEENKEKKNESKN
jgi:large subunit ribosomal protein L32e